MSHMYKKIQHTNYKNFLQPRSSLDIIVFFFVAPVHAGWFFLSHRDTDGCDRRWQRRRRQGRRRRHCSGVQTHGLCESRLDFVVHFGRQCSESRRRRWRRRRHRVVVGSPTMSKTAVRVGCRRTLDVLDKLVRELGVWRGVAGLALFTVVAVVGSCCCCCCCASAVRVNQRQPDLSGIIRTAMIGHAIRRSRRCRRRRCHHPCCCGPRLHVLLSVLQRIHSNIDTRH